MADERVAPAGAIKIKRARRRVYEEAAALPAAAPEAAAASLAHEEPVARPAPGANTREALRLVRTYMFWSFGAGLVPIPLFDTIAVVAVQTRMVKKLCAIYGLNYSHQRAKSLVASLITGVYAGLIAGSMIRLVPIVGVVSLAAIPAASGALTYAVGRVFIQHFQCGGTLLDFDPAKAGTYLAAQYEEGRRITPSAGTTPR